MTETKIRRMKFTQVEPALVGDRERLAKNASSILGYKKLAQALVLPDALLFALRKLEIAPLAPASVAAYKTKKAKSGMWSGHKRAYACFACSLFLAYQCLRFGHVLNMSDGAYFTFIVLLGAGALISGIAGVMNRFDSDLRGSRTTRTWKLLAIADYDGTIPEFVLHKAVQIKSAVPKAGLLIDQLFTETEIAPIRERDPFLVVRLGDETYYIDVWDEKEYEATL